MCCIEKVDIAESLDLLVGSRSKDIEELKQKMTERFSNNLKNLQSLKIIELVEDTYCETVCDDMLIGSILVTDKGGREVQYDIQLWYIKDNQDNYYITETEILEEVI